MTEHLYPIYALWAHPRSMSTALERVMRERGDLDCLHEPFMYDYYIHRQTRRMPMFEPEDGRPVSYADMRADVLDRASRGPVFFKDMSYYVMPHLMQDAAFCDAITHTFLVRDPVAAIASYAALDPDVTVEEIGIEAQWRHFEALQQRGVRAAVLCAEDVRADPMGVIGAWWARVGLPEAPHAFDWQSGTPEDWQQVAGWHGAVTASRGIRPITEADRQKQRDRFDAAAVKRPELRGMLEHHQQFHQRLLEHVTGGQGDRP